MNRLRKKLHLVQTPSIITIQLQIGLVIALFSKLENFKCILLIKYWFGFLYLMAYQPSWVFNAKTILEDRQ